MPKEDYNPETLRKKIKRVDSLIQDETPSTPSYNRLAKKRAKYVKQLSQHELPVVPTSFVRTSSLMISNRENDDDPTPAQKEKDKTYSYETLEKKIALVEFMMKDEDNSFTEEYKKLERKKNKYVALLKETDKWKELHPNGDSDLKTAESKDMASKPAASRGIFYPPRSDSESSHHDTEEEEDDTEMKPTPSKGIFMPPRSPSESSSEDHDTEEEEDDFDMGGTSLKPGTVPEEVRLGGSGGYQLTDNLDEGSLSSDQKKCRDMLLKLMALNGEQPGTKADLDEDFLITLCEKVSEIFLKDDMVLKLKAPLKICADIHGQFFDLLRIFDYGDYPSKSNYLFLGDYVDRGKQSVEVVSMLFGFKFLFPEKLHMLRGNHEIGSINRIYGFHDECKRKYSPNLYQAFVKAFNCMPVVAVIDETVVCMHAGISPNLMDLNEVDKMERPCEIPEEGWLCDFVWSDPDPDVTGFEESDRGVSYLFGSDALDQFLEKNDYELVVRGHQVIEDGYQFFHQRKLVTLFSAPNYCGEFDNAGAIMIIAKDMTCSFQVFQPVKRHRRSLIKEFSTKGYFVTDDKTEEEAAADAATSGRSRYSIQAMNQGSSVAKEKSADRKSYSRPSVDTGRSGFSEVFFRDKNLTQTMKVEDLTRKNTSWGDIWEDLFYDDTQLAEFKYDAFMEDLEDTY
eukprot:CAMPEP_0113621242 /NCGR_PEP_ID=MMETSP0017_2-20120614/10848_1 /TAXON_ID=2856 /ORGANISM="Cylindrotheca closterium" /LENGTH=679 /DNA_ID=CAMNT_0000530969 /DNA_START=139 /DNA_END=2178 /DNA_ORIENTATION=+ /assembly_acc=CAM_ASM_000147